MIDIVFDLETCSKRYDAAVLQIAAVACDFDKHGEGNGNGEPWLRDSDGDIECFNRGIDLNEQFLQGSHFDADTQQWWMSDKRKDARKAVLDCQRDRIEVVMYDFNEWLKDLSKQYGNEPVCVWAQGSDFDIPKLYHMYQMAGITEENRAFAYNYVRCARTYCLEALAEKTGDRLSALMEVDGHKVNDLYKQIPTFQMPDGGQGTVHDAMFDSMRSAWNVWWLMKEGGI